MAYIPSGSEKVVITDTLPPQMEFVDFFRQPDVPCGRHDGKQRIP